MLVKVIELSFGMILGVIALFWFLSFLLSAASLLGRMGPYQISTPLLVSESCGIFLFVVTFPTPKLIPSRISFAPFLPIGYVLLFRTVFFGRRTQMICSQSSLYTWIFLPAGTATVNPKIWSSKAPPRVISFLWAAGLRKILTQDNLRKRGRTLVSVYPFCLHASKESNSSSHSLSLFFWSLVLGFKPVWCDLGYAFIDCLSLQTLLPSRLSALLMAIIFICHYLKPLVGTQ